MQSTSASRTSHLDAEIRGTVRRTSVKSSSRDRVSIFSIRSIDLAVSLHILTNCEREGKFGNS